MLPQGLLLDGGGEGETKVSEHAADKVCVDGRHVRFVDIVHGVDSGVRRFAVNRWDIGVLKPSASLSAEVTAMVGGGEK